MTPMGSVLAGACVLEKHVNFVGVESPDSPHSLNEHEFKLMVKAVRGDVEPRLGPTPEETEMLLRHNRRLIATKDIKSGETFRENENFGIYRSLKDDTHALSPFAITHVIGKEAKREIQAGNGIGPGDF
jgi:sialic acid synthase SpsE